ncbi:MAG TPA: NUDIX hydrolase [Symbiobacteriaceae bacterium]|nr:NUDIX hydrolase [Symbiobacteriaceae bacterium]
MYEIRSVKVTVRGREFTRDVVDHPGSVCVLALTTEDRIVFVRQNRPGIGRESLELPGGRRRPNEAPEDAARREMEAETGLKPLNLRLVGTFYPAPGYSSEEVYCFVTSQMEPGCMQFDESEDLQVEFLPFSAAMQAVRRGEIVDGRSIVALLRWGDEMYGGLKASPLTW